MILKKKNTRIKLHVKKNTQQIGLILLCMIFLSTIILAQTTEWITKKTKDGKITVKSSVSKRTDENGNEVQLIEYVATTTVTIDILKCAQVIKDISFHKEFLENTAVSKKLENISENEWLIYYYFEAPLFFSDSDCVMKMTYRKNDSEDLISFKGVAVPDSLEDKGVKRYTYYTVVYLFKKIEPNKTEITISEKTTPPSKAPAWMVKRWFPKGPAKMLNRIIDLAKSIEIKEK